MNYKITRDGRVFNGDRELVLSLSPNGYYHIRLGRGKHYLVSRLVAEKYLPNPHNLPEVNHKDKNPLNNNVDNLEWCTSLYNRLHAGKMFTYIITDKAGNVYATHSLKEFAKQYKLNRYRMLTHHDKGWRVIEKHQCASL